MTAEARCEIRNTSHCSDLQFLKAFSSLACLASNCNAHAHTKSAIIQVELPHFSLCRVSLWRCNNGMKDGSIIVYPKTTAEASLSYGPNLQLGKAGHCQGFQVYGTSNVVFCAGANAASLLRVLQKRPGYLRTHLPVPPPPTPL